MLIPNLMPATHSKKVSLAHALFDYTALLLEHMPNAALCCHVEVMNAPENYGVLKEAHVAPKCIQC